MERRHPRYILASARNGSFSAAGYELNVRQPIISKRIKELEDELGGVVLFERSTGGARLTPTGEKFVVAARRIIEDVERLTEWTKAIAAGKVGRIVVGFYKSLSAGGLRAGLRDFREQHPDIDVELFGTSGRRAAGRPSDGREAGDLLAGVEGERFLISDHDPGPDIHAILLRHLTAPSDHPEIVTRRLSRESILSEVAGGQGIALQCESANGLTSLGVVFRPLHDGSGAARLGYIVCWKPDNTNPALETFLAAIRPPT